MLTTGLDKELGPGSPTSSLSGNGDNDDDDGDDDNDDDDDNAVACGRSA